MASAALMTLPNQKEPNVLARASLLPKRKPIVSTVTTRARFIKPRPNVVASASKASKEVPPPSENTKADNDESSQAVEAESETLQRPTIPKRAATIPAVSRARFQRARPNIGALMNKSKDVQQSEIKSVPTLDSTITEEASDVKSDKADNSTTESTSEKSIKKDGKSVPVESSLNVEKVIDTASSVCETQNSPQPIVNLDSVCGNYEEFSNIRTVPEVETVESHTEKNFSSDMPEKELTELSSHSSEICLTSPRETLPITPEKENPSTSAVLNKSIEYPTLKSILNSPRKRTATKKVHERRKRIANLPATPSRSEMTMVDLIYWNPSSSPMKQTTSLPSVQDLLPVDDPKPKPPIEEEPEDSNIGPKVIINDDGEIILDESSLFVRRKDTVDHSVAAIVVNDNTTYSSFRNRTVKSWSKRETVKFYKALSLVGTDFALMENIFKEDGQVTRSRRELKLKFKREEKSNPKFVHTAMYELQTYDINILDDDQNFELLEESEFIDDAPKQAKRATSSGTKVPGKRRRKRKSEMTEISINENTSESIYAEVEESEKANEDLFSNEDDQNKTATDFITKSSTSRLGRARKAKILSDYVTNVDDLIDANDYLDNEEETLPLKKRKRIQVLSEEDEADTDRIVNNGSSIEDHYISIEETPSTEEIYPFPTEETDDNEKSGTASIKKARTLPMLPKISEENSEISDSVYLTTDTVVPETSRSGRKIKTKKMVDFVTDPCGLSELDEDMTAVEKVPDSDRENILWEENAENRNSIKSVNQQCDSPQLQEDFSIIPSAGTDCEYPEEQVICTLDVENPNEDNLVMESSDVKEQIEPNNSEVISTAQVLSSTETLSPVISYEKPMINNLLNIPESEICNDINDCSILTDPVINEVVVTSDQIPRRTRRKILPNVIKGSKRPPIPKKPVLPPRRTSFTSFTPVEEIETQITSVRSVKTYSRQSIQGNNTSKLVKSEDLSDMPEYLETVHNSPSNVSRKRSLSGPAKSPCTPDINIRTNSVYTSIRSPLTNTPLNVFSFNSAGTPPISQPSKEVPLNSSDPKATDIKAENVADSSPVVFLTRTPNNSNMLHLFVYQKS